jgi:L-threonylcarbamoyladenylate synthase
MQTILTRDARKAAEVVRNGGLAAFPTETVYGLGANIFDEGAVSKIFVAKGRPADNPLIAHVGERSQIEELAAEIPATADLLIDAFFPGPLTLVLPKSDRISKIASAGLTTIGIRMPAHDLARDFLHECGTPVVAPSANRSGRPSPTTWQAVAEDLDGLIDCILQGEATQIGLESTVVDCSSAVPALLRRGAVSIDDLRRVVPEIVGERTTAEQARRSPGTRYRHYSPRARVRVVTADEIVTDAAAAFIGMSGGGDWAYSRFCDSIEQYAREVFEFFREADRRGIETIYCQAVPEMGIGAALMDRLRRASAG